MNDSQRTVVNQDGDWLGRHRRLAELALAEAPGPQDVGHSRHLAFLQADALDLDLADPSQRDFGDYELVEKLGQGGMGVVYRARQKSLDRQVALKLLAAGPWASSEFIGRFRREAQSAARMQHPNIVSVFEIGSHDALNFFTMALVQGDSLARRLSRQGPMSNRDAAALIRTVAEAVNYAHRLDVLHLDLKPANILINERDEPMVADFGLARRLDDPLAREEEEICGTPSYMAPEQAVLGGKLSVATDIYGLGAMLYEALTGRPPFVGSTPQDTLNQVVAAAPQPLRALLPQIDRDLEAICLCCLRPDPAERYASARELADDLGRYLDGRAVSVRPLGTLQRSGRWAIREPRLALLLSAFLISLFSGLLVSAYQWQRAEASSDTAMRLLWDSRREAALRHELDGRGFDALPRLLANIDEQQRSGAPDAAADLARVDMLLARGAQLLDILAIADASPLSLALSPQGKLLALGLSDRSVRWYDSTTMTERGRVNLSDRPTSDGQPRAPLLLRFIDEDRLMVTLEWYSNQTSPNTSDSWLVDLSESRLIEPPSAFDDFADASYSANARYAVLRDRQRRWQLWSTSPWTQLSGMGAAQPDALPMLVAPDGRFVLFLRAYQRQLLRADPADSGNLIEIQPLHGLGISAWSLSPDGETLAIGNYEGQISLYETRQWTIRNVPVSRGHEVSWLAFSADGTWLAAANRDGAVHALDAQTGQSLVAGTLHHDFPVQRVDIDRDRQMLIASGAGQVALWRIPLTRPRAAAAIRLGSSPTGHTLAGRYAMGWSWRSGLFASAGIDGQTRLWRLPGQNLLAARAPHQIPAQLYFDGNQVVDVDWEQLRISPLADPGAEAWTELPQAPGFAQLLDQGHLLVSSLGPQLQVYDLPSLQPRYPALALPSSPQRMLASPNGSIGIFSLGDKQGNEFVERLWAFDLRSGRRLPGEVVLPGPLRLLSFDPRARRLLVVGPAEGATTVLELPSLRLLAEYPHDPFEPVQWAAFSADDASVLLVRRAMDPRLGSDALLKWSLADDEVQLRPLARLTRPLGILALPGGVLVAGSDADLYYTSDGADSDQPRTLERQAHSDATALLALSADGRLIARGFQHEVQIHDAQSGALLGPPLRSGSNAVDVIVAVAFAPAGDQLLGLTLQGRWLHWRLAPPHPAALEVSRAVARHALAPEDQRVLIALSSDERFLLRAADPGPWPATPARPELPHDFLAERDSTPIPHRPPGLSPHLLDLSAFYEAAPETVRNPFAAPRTTLRPYPIGVQRIAGTDFDIRGADGITTGMFVRELGAVEPQPVALECVPTPDVWSALNVLSMQSLRAPVPSGKPLYRLRLHYADGDAVELPLRAGSEVPGFAGADRRVDYAFTADPVPALSGLSQAEVLFRSRLVNPHPQRLVRCLDLEGLEPGAVLMPLAMTTEAALSP